MLFKSCKGNRNQTRSMHSCTDGFNGQGLLLKRTVFSHSSILNKLPSLITLIHRYDVAKVKNPSFYIHVRNNTNGPINASF